MNIISVEFESNFWEQLAYFFRHHGEFETRRVLLAQGHSPVVVNPYIRRLKKGVLSEKDPSINGNPKE